MVTALYEPIELRIYAESTAPGTSVHIESNVPARVWYTCDGSYPNPANPGTKVEYTPVSLQVYNTCTVRAIAADTRREYPLNKTGVVEVEIPVSRVSENNAEKFRDHNHFYTRLLREVVDENFYCTEGWVVPYSETNTYQITFFNPETADLLSRLLINGVDTLGPNTWPTISARGAHEFVVFLGKGPSDMDFQTTF